MKFETIKWIFQRVSTPIILILFFYFFYNSYQIKDFSYPSIHTFFLNYTNLFLFFIFILFSLLHTAIEVFHSIHDYFSGTKNESLIKYLILILYLLIIFIIIFFLFNFIILL